MPEMPKETFFIFIFPSKEPRNITIKIRIKVLAMLGLSLGNIRV
jgi:hypothetical protein